MELLLIILMVLTSVGVIVFAVLSHFKKVEKEKYYMAAGNIIREDFLNYSLQNTVNNENTYKMPSTKKMMLYIKSKTAGKKAQFVFDPEKKILIGRDKFDSNIYINEAFVSHQHCTICIKDNAIILQDMNSTNGTIIKRGLFNKFLIANGQYIELKSKDKVIIGSNKFTITLFYYDMNIM